MTTAPLSVDRRRGSVAARSRHAAGALMASAPNALIGLDPAKRRVLHVSAGFENLMGTPAGRVLGRAPTAGGLPADAAAAIERAVGAALATGDSAITSFELPARGADGGRHHFEAAATRVRGEDGGRDAQVIVVLRDVTRQRELIDRYERALAEERQRLEAAQARLRLRERLLALLSHEMRSPLHAMQNWTHLLDSGMATTAALRRRALQGLLSGIEAQVRTLDRLLDPEPAANEDDGDRIASCDVPVLMPQAADRRRARGP